MAAAKSDEARDGVTLTNLDQPLFEDAGVDKRQLVDYLDAVRDRIIPVLRDRPLSVIRATHGQAPFFQKNVPKYTPDFVATIDVWAEASHRNVSYALCNDRKTLLWFANQRAIEYHPALATASRLDHATHMILDLDPPDSDAFGQAVTAAHLVHEVLDQLGLRGALKTSGAKGLHIFVPIADTVTMPDAAATTRAIARRVEMLDPSIATTAFLKADRAGKIFIDATRAGGATVVAAYSPRVRPGAPVSFPIGWNELDHIKPGDFTIVTALERLGDRDRWAESMPEPQSISADLIAEGHEIPIPRAAAMHEGKRRAKARRDGEH